MHIELIRHGLPLGGSKYRGNKIDDVLSDTGWAQMRAAITGQDHFDAVFSSPLLRCCDFAREVAEARAVPVHIIDNLKEIGFGEWEGLTRDEVKATKADEYQRFYANPGLDRPTGAEDLNHFCARVAKALTEVLEHGHERVLVVAHAGVLRAALVHALNMPAASMYQIDVKNAARISLSFNNDQFKFHQLSA